MIPYLRESIGAIAGAALMAGVGYVYYEGVPVVRSVPFIEYVPIIGDLAEGRVERERKAALKGYVREAQLIAERAKLAEVQRQLEAGRRALAGYAALLAEAQAREAALAEQDAIEDAEYEATLKAGGRSCPIGSDTIDWLRR